MTENFREYAENIKAEIFKLLGQTDNDNIDTPELRALLTQWYEESTQQRLSTLDPQIQLINDILPENLGEELLNKSPKDEEEGFSIRQEIDDQFMWSPAHYVARAGSVEILRFLKNLGAPINDKAFQDVTPLMCAAYGAHASVILEYFKDEKNVDAFAAEDSMGNTTAHYLAMSKEFDVKTALRVLYLSEKARESLTKSCNHNWETPIHRAITHENFSFLEGVHSINPELLKGLNPPLVHQCVYARSKTCLKFLYQNLNHKLVKEEDLEGNNAIHLIAKMDDLSIAEEFIPILHSYGVPIEAENNDGRKPADLTNDSEIQLLLSQLSMSSNDPGGPEISPQ